MNSDYTNIRVLSWVEPTAKDFSGHVHAHIGGQLAIPGSE